MNRKTFLQLCAGAAASGFGLARSRKAAATVQGILPGPGVQISSGSTGGVRRLSSERQFGFWHAGLEPAYRVRLNEVVIVETTHGQPGLVTREGVFAPAPEGYIANPETGPIYVEGIEPGDALAIDFLDVRTGDWGYCGRKVFEIRGGYILFDDRLRLPVLPFPGCVGIAPAEGRLDTRAPGETGGNLDCKEVRAGSTLVFTAQVPGALVGMGDGHARQGDGETRGQGLETDLEIMVRFRRLPEALSPRPVILRPEYIATLAALEDLTEAAWQATGDMVKLVARLTHREEEDVRRLVSLVGDLKINQIVDPAKGARMEIPAWILGA